MSVVQLCGVAVLTAAMALTVKATGSKLAPLVPLFGGTVLLMAAIARYREPINAMLTLAEEAGISSSVGTVVKMLAVGGLCTMASDICRDLGEGTLAARVELCGRAEILLLCLPFLLELITLALGLAA